MDSQNMNNGTNNYQDNTGYQQNSPATSPEKSGSNALAIVGLVLGIISIITCCCSYIGCIFGIAGLICSILGKKQSPSGIATAGLICSIIGIVLGGIVLILGLIGMSMDPEAYLNSLENMM
ncbi:MAG: DUF4190 domain-containing protein [Roseburia sp.]|nr:DUF4190 domain-containing protein [Roseburia sp.]